MYSISPNHKIKIYIFDILCVVTKYNYRFLMLVENFLIICIT